MACTCRFMLASSSTTGLSAASASSAHLIKADFSVAQSARFFLKLSLSCSMALKALANSSFALEVSACWGFRFPWRSATWLSFVFSSACMQTVICFNKTVQGLKYQPHNKLCTWHLGANAYLIFRFHLIIKSQAQYKYSTWHLGANGYLLVYILMRRSQLLKDPV